jgi:steroid 5-alpha reductase family enzyme
MEIDLSPYIATFAVTATAMAALWLLSLKLKNASIVDIYWGPGFAVIAWVAFLAADNAGSRAVLVAGLVSLWAGRLGLYLLWRAIKKRTEDSRYAAMRARRGPGFAVWSLGGIFGLQAVLMWLVSLPHQAGILHGSDRLSPLSDSIGLALFLFGFLFEAIGDWQLARFKSDPTNDGKVMNRGLWSLTRHPNYFGDACVHWGLFLVSAPAAGAWWTVAGPTLMTFLLVRVSGAALLDRRMARANPAYKDYMEHTSGFLPRLRRPDRSDLT